EHTPLARCIPPLAECFPTQNLRYQIGTSSGDRKSVILRYQFGIPSVTTADVAIGTYVFTGHGAKCYVSTPALHRMLDSRCGNEEQNANIRILTIRGQKVVIDVDLAHVYGVTTKRLNEQFRRNRNRFPKDFPFQLTTGEFECLRSQIATLNESNPGRAD